MKKILVTFLCAAMLVAVAGMFACDISGDGTPHTHEYMQVAGERFLKSPATCTESAVYYYSCKCGEKAAETFNYGSPLGHAFSDYVSDNNATYTSDGTKTAKCDRCGATNTVPDEGTMLKSGIEFGNLGVDGNKVYGSVPNSQTDFDFLAELTVHGEIIYRVSNNKTGSDIIESKTAELEIGDNTYYILVYSDSELIDRYTVTIRRRPIYTVKFNTNGGTEIADMQVEEGSLITDAKTSKTGYTLSGWDYDFTTPVTDNLTVTASWTANTDTPYKTEYYLQNFENDDYTLTDTVNLQGITAATANAEIKEYTHFTYNQNISTASGTVNGDGSLVLKLYYTRNSYTLLNNGESFGVISPESATFKYGTKITASATEFLGCEFIGWYNGENMLTKEQQYTFNIECDVTAKFSPRSEMSAFIFESTEDTCKITGITDKNATKIVVPDYVTEIDGGAFSGCSYLQEITLPFVGNRANVKQTDIIQYPFGYIFGENQYTNSVETWQFFYDTSTNSTTNNTYYYIPKALKSVIITGGNILYDDAFRNCNGLTNITIPDSVTSIGERAFSDCTSLTNITIPDSVTSIGEWAFSDCTGLTNITIPDSVTSIGEWAFSSCTDLTNITTPDSVTSIGEAAFWGCSGLTNITIPDSVTSIGDSAFNGCSGLKSITIPDSVTSIGEGAFFGCSGLTSITIPDSVSSIGSSAFSNCSGLTSITIPDSVTSIGSSAFSNCSGLTSINLPHSVTNIGSCALRECSSLTSINIPDSVTSIGSRAFGDCSGLTSINIPDSVISIGDSAFSFCSSLTNITIPDSVTSIGSGAFFGCSGLTSITIPDNVTSISYETFRNCTGLMSATIGSTSIGDYAFYACSGLTSITMLDGVNTIGNYVFTHCSELTSVVIPESITSIGAYAFSGCDKLFVTIGGVRYVDNWLISVSDKSLTTVEIQNGTKGIAASAFTYCRELTSITIPDSVTSIGEAAFWGCSGLTSIIIPDNVTLIGYETFKDCSLTSIILPNSITSIGIRAFHGCSDLTSIVIPDSVTSIGLAAFSGCSELTSITVSANNSVYYSINNCLIERESGVLVLGCKNSLIPTDDGVTSIGDSAFNGCSGLKSITMPDSVTSIGDSAFNGCSGLKSITIPDSVTSIGEAAFLGCSGLTSIIIPNNVTSIGYETFKDCIALTSIILPNSITSIGIRAFRGCSNLTSIVIPDSVTSIDLAAFSGCTRLTSITIPDSVTSIASGAFYQCQGLTTITIPDSVTSIGARAFEYCNSLKSIYYTGNEEQWKKISISSYNEKLTSATRYYYSETEPTLNADGTAYIGNYWHYDTDGKTPVIWKKEK